MPIDLPMAQKDLLFQVTRNENARSEAERDQILADPPFGQVFTDHMVDICWMAPAPCAALRADRA